MKGKYGGSLFEVSIKPRSEIINANGKSKIFFMSLDENVVKAAFSCLYVVFQVISEAIDLQIQNFLPPPVDHIKCPVRPKVNCNSLCNISS